MRPAPFPSFPLCTMQPLDTWGLESQAYDARRAAKDAEREAVEAAQEAEIARAAAERAAREEAEAEKWKATFTVEAVGEAVLSEQDATVRARSGQAVGGVR